MQADLFGESLPELLVTMEQMRGKLLTFLSLAEKFRERYQLAKREKNIADFNDLEQMALEILVKKDGVTLCAHRRQKNFPSSFTRS